MKKIVLTFFMPLLFSSCGYFENDGLKYRKVIVGNIGIEQHNGSDKIDLAFHEANEICAVVVGDCRSVYYDSIKNMIYVESPITKSNSSYYRIVLKDPSSEMISGAIKKDVIDKSTFEKGITRNGVQVKLK